MPTRGRGNWQDRQRDFGSPEGKPEQPALVFQAYSHSMVAGGLPDMS